MYTSFTIENFRLFDHLTVEPLARVNLIAGENNAGKTALLEAISLHAVPNEPRMAWFISAERGLPGIEPGEFFSDLFYKYQTDKHIKFKATGDWDSTPRVLTVRRQPRAASTDPLVQTAMEVPQTARMIFDSEFRDELVFEYHDENEKLADARVWIQPDATSAVAGPGPLRWHVSDDGVHFTRSLILTAIGRLDDISLTGAFGQAVREGHLPTIEEIVRVLEPRLNNLSAVPNRLGTSLIYADTGMGRMAPIALMGEGAKRLLTLALAFLHARGTAILIDEIENGLHYSKLKEVWKWLIYLSQEFNVQIFATTHSYECIYAAHSAFKEQESASDFAFFRLQRNYETGSIECVAYDDIESFDYAMAYGKEVR